MNSQSSIMSEMIRRVVKSIVSITQDTPIPVEHTEVANGITYHIDGLGKVLADKAIRSLLGIPTPESKRPSHVGVTVTTNGTIVYTGVCISKPKGIYNKPIDLCPVRATVGRDGCRTEYMSAVPEYQAQVPPTENYHRVSRSIGRDGKLTETIYTI